MEDMYKCLADGYGIFKRGGIYSGVDINGLDVSVQTLVFLYPDHWELVQKEGLDYEVY